MKNFIFITLISLFGLLPFLAMAVDITPGTIPNAQQLGLQESPVKTSQGLIDVIISVVKIVYTVFFIIAVLFIIFAAFKYLTSVDAPDKIKEVHKQLIYAAIAIAVALMAVSAQVIVSSFLEGDNGGLEEQADPGRFNLPNNT